MNKVKLKVGDSVMVRKGSEKGKSGKILSIDPSSRMVVVDGLNKVKKHQKPSQRLPKGGIFEEIKPLAVANVGLVHPSSKGKTVKIGLKIDTKGKKKRTYKHTGKEI